MRSVERGLVIFLLFIGSAGLADEFRFSGDNVQSVFAKGKERTVLQGNARVQSDDNLIQSEMIELYGKDLIYALCQGQVKLINLKKGIELTCDKMFYDRNAKIVRVQGNAVMTDRENEIVVKGGFIESSDEKLELSGMPVVFWKGDEYRARKIFIDLKTDEIKLEGEVAGAVTAAGTKEKSDDR
jgi:lipopolysaccharide export system protein LptA